MNQESKAQADPSNASKGCDCAAQVDANLAAHGAKLERGFGIHPQTMDLSAWLLLRTKKTTASRKPVPAVRCHFCPFCGTKAN